MNERHTEHVLTMSAEAAEFADELGFSDQPGDKPFRGSGTFGFAGRDGSRVLRGTGGSPLVRWSALGAAAAIVLVVGVWFAVLGQPAASPTAPAALIVAKAEQKATVPALADEPNVNMIVALFRDDDRASDECPACWCVTRWHEDWGTGRDITEVLGDELLAASKDRRCVARPQQMIVVGLSGPASAMPASDELARQLALCLAEKQDDPSLRDGGGGAGYRSATLPRLCLPVGVDYRLATWTR